MTTFRQIEDALLKDTNTTFKNPILNSIFGKPNTDTQLAFARVARPVVAGASILGIIYALLRMATPRKRA
jgi:hypothetical protein